MADYWIKWYHEIIDDPKMATLPDRLWRRFSECCLLAGRLCQDKSGEIPDTRQLAWLLRMNTDELQLDMDQLEGAGLIESIPNGWLVVNFNKRQQPATGNERVKQYRERKQKKQYYSNVTEQATEDVTQTKRNVTQINRLTESETESESEVGTLVPYCEAFTRLTGIPETSFSRHDVTALVDVQKAGVTVQEFEQAIHILQDKNFTISGPKSIRNTAIGALNKRNGSNVDIETPKGMTWA